MGFLEIKKNLKISFSRSSFKAFYKYRIYFFQIISVHPRSPGRQHRLSAVNNNLQQLNAKLQVRNTRLKQKANEDDLENIKSDLSAEAYLEIQEKSALIPKVFKAVSVCNRCVYELHPDLFQNLDKHVENLGSHKNKIIKLSHCCDNESQASLQIEKLSENQGLSSAVQVNMYAEYTQL